MVAVEEGGELGDAGRECIAAGADYTTGFAESTDPMGAFGEVIQRPELEHSVEAGVGERELPSVASSAEIRPRIGAI